MAKKLVVALMLAAAFIGAIFIVISVLKKNEAVVYNMNYTWRAENDQATGVDTLIRGNKIDRIKNDVNKLITALNKAVEDAEASRPQGDGVNTEFPQINLQKVEQQTANIEISNDQYLTQSMGSSGAQDYLAEVTFTLTENPGIKAVNFLFNAGDHAMPGLYSRESFTSYKITRDDSKR